MVVAKDMGTEPLLEYCGRTMRYRWIGRLSGMFSKGGAHMPIPFSDEVPELLQSHLEHLLESAIGVDIIRERGYKSALGKYPLEQAGFAPKQRRAPGIIMPQFAPDGSAVGSIFRPDNPRTSTKGKPTKYETPAGAGLRIDTHPRCLPFLPDPSIELFVTEGTKKVDSLVTHGACAIGLNGVWSFKTKNQFGAVTFSADFDYIALKHRCVYIVFDSDSLTNPKVRKALDRMREHLVRKEADVKVIKLPQILTPNQSVESKNND